MRKARSKKNPAPRAKRTPTTVYLDPGIARAIKVRAALHGKSVSDLANESFLRLLREDEKHIRLIRERSGGPVRSYENVVKELRRDGLL